MRLEFWAIHGVCEVAVYAVQTNRVVVGVLGFVGFMVPGGSGFCVTGGVVWNAFCFEVVPNIGVGPFAHGVKLPRSTVGTDDILGERDLAFD